MKKNRHNRTARRRHIQQVLAMLPQPLPLPLELRPRSRRPPRPQVYALRSLTAGGMHAWLTTSAGRIRKPTGSYAVRPGLISLAS